MNIISLFYFFSSGNLETTNTTDDASTTTTTTAPPSTTLKTITIREPLEFKVELLDYSDPSPEAQANSIKK